ncbi:FecR family protein [Arenibacter sp. TNZ]|jgi:ferric-dicitrate binding protein FerR (iron transport regulator)|uniref:FecR family protein n=1 Tax=Arenibacter TaxID=178469 RepID=UPI000CD3BDB9|nr:MULTISPECIES: FecR domain-containing protein [Arenibacter]MCM4170361.1 FecR family protein [Arenibacter sp. TNZ]
MQENYLAKWLNNELSEEEVVRFKESKEYASYVKLRKATDNLVGPDFDMAKAWEDLNKQKTSKESKVVKLNPFKKYLSIAAAVAVIFTASYLYYGTLNEEVSTQFAERAEIVLPDASEVQLNADSQISYSKKNWDNKRNIVLNGEAFFKVAKGKRFTVTTENGTVTVLGTQFNVENRKGYFEVACYEGLVSVIYNKKEVKLPAGNSLVVINGELQALEIPNIKEPSWIRNESNFKSIPLKYVLDEFQRQFNLVVTTQNIDTDQLFTGSFSNTDKDLALQSISTPSQMKYKLEGNKVLFYAETP